MKKSVTIISPVYNEEAVIEHFYLELSRVLQMLHDQYETRILFVLDRSSDKSLAIIKKIAERDNTVSCLAMSARFGHQMALLAGIDHARSDIYIMMDSDLQHPPSLIPEMLAECAKGYDIVFTVRKATEAQNLLRRWIGDFFYVFINALSDAKIYRNAADFRLITDKVARIFRERLRERNMFMRGLMSWVGFQQKALDYVAASRFAGHSKYSFRKMAKMATDAIFAFSSFPLKVSLVMGSLLSCAGFIYGLFTVMQYFFHATLPSGYATMVVLITLFSGIQLLCLGMMGIYIGAIYTEVKGRPHYIVDEYIGDQSAYVVDRA